VNNIHLYSHSLHNVFISDVSAEYISSISSQSHYITVYSNSAILMGQYSTDTFQVETVIDSTNNMRINCTNHKSTVWCRSVDYVTCTTNPPATGELEFVFHSSGVAADTAGCWILGHIGCRDALGRDDWDTMTDDSGDATLMMGCDSVNTCDVDGVNWEDARCNQQVHYSL